MKTADRKPEFLSAKEVCVKLGIGVRTWRRLVAMGRAPQPRKLTSRLIRWAEREIDEWIETKEGQPT